MPENLPGKFKKADFTELESIYLLGHIFSANKMVVPDLKILDRWPNTDGYLYLVNEAGLPIGRLFVQVKALPSSCNKKTKTLSYTFNQEDHFLAYCYSSEEAYQLPILFIAVDTKQKKAYWAYITPEDAKEIEKDNKKILLKQENVIAYDDISYYWPWVELCRERQKVVREMISKKETKEKEKILNTLINK